MYLITEEVYGTDAQAFHLVCVTAEYRFVRENMARHVVHRTYQQKARGSDPVLPAERR